MLPLATDPVFTFTTYASKMSKWADENGDGANIVFPKCSKIAKIVCQMPMPKSCYMHYISILRHHCAKFEENQPEESRDIAKTVRKYPE